MRGASLLVLAAGLALAAPQRYEMRSYVNIGGKVQPAFAWCDAPGRVLAVTQPAKPPVSPQPVSLVTWLKGVKGNPTTDTVQLGPGDAGAGNIYTALTPPGVAVPGTPTSYVHTSNVENVNDPAYRMTRVNEFRLNGRSYRCRYQPRAAFMGATAKRTVIVWDSGDQITYATRNFGGTPGVLVTGGQLLHSADVPKEGGGHDFKRRYVWKARGGYSYALSLSQDGASVRVEKNGRVLQVEPFLAYSISLPASLPAGARP